MNTTQHTQYMSLALRLAEQGRPTVSPNPMVGCVIVKNKQVVGQGFHRQAGEAHAEVIALQEAGDQSKGATAYLTLEPCCHFGRTPPCTDTLIKSGIKKVYFSCIDPNPLVAGKSITILRSAGIEVEVGLCEGEAIELNEIFFHFIKNQRPYVIAKWAMSLDGKTKVHSSDDRQMSCEASQYHTHQIRQQVDGILVGANTVLQDNPLLTVRFQQNALAVIKQPLRIILAGHQPFPVNLKVINGELEGTTLVVTTERNKHLFADLASAQVEVLIMPENTESQICLSALLDELGRRKVTSLLVEGGMTTHERFFQEQLVNKIHMYLTPQLIGLLPQKTALNFLNVSKMGDDVHVVANIKV